MADLVPDYEPICQVILKWVKEPDDEILGDGSVDLELKQLRQEVRELLEDQVILEKAAAWFVKRRCGRCRRFARCAS